LGKNNSCNSYYLFGSLIPTSDVVVDLGVSIDHSNLKFDCHINNIVSKALSRVGCLFKGFCCRSPLFLKTAFVTYVRPLLEYASNVWNPYLLKHINVIENVQRRFTKRIPSLSHLSYPERLAALDLESLELRRLKADLVLYYKILHNLVNIPRSHLPPTPREPNTHTRSEVPHLSLPVSSTNELDNNFFSRCVSSWNFLPQSAVSSSSIKTFKTNISTVDFSPFLHGTIFNP
jgi:hypothetical protein